MSTAPVVLVGFDGSDDGLAALDFGIDEALGRGGVLSVVNVVDDTLLASVWGAVYELDAVRRAGLELLASARSRAVERGLPVDRYSDDCVIGQPAAVLSQLSQSAAVAVVGRRYESGTESLFVGSTPVGLAGTASCPVVVTSARIGRPPHRGVVGVGLDPDGRDPLALRWAARRAQRVGSSVLAVAAVRPPAGRMFGGRVPEPTDEQKQLLFDHVTERVEAAVDSVRTDTPVGMEVRYRYGSPADELVALSSEVDMLIVGVRPVFPTYSVGGLVRALMTHAHCPLGVVRHR